LIVSIYHLLIFYLLIILLGHIDLNKERVQISLYFRGARSIRKTEIGSKKLSLVNNSVTTMEHQKRIILRAKNDAIHAGLMTAPCCNLQEKVAKGFCSHQTFEGSSSYLWFLS
jgi:hypothetical protein